MGDTIQNGRLYLEPEGESFKAHNDLPCQISEDQPLLDYRFIQPEPTRVESPQGIAIICCTVSVLFVSCALNSLVTLNIPQLSSEFGLKPGVELWPMSMYYLAQGCTFLLAGSLDDVFGSRKVFLFSCFLQTICYLCSGLANTGMQLIALRTVSGVAYPMCFVSAMSIHSDDLPIGKLRNLAFFCTSISQYIGSGFGILLSGVLSETVGWQWGFRGAAVLSLSALLLSIWAIPKQSENPKYATWAAMAEDIDLAGTMLASSLMALLFAALAVITNNVANIGKSGLFIPVALGWIILVAFLFWQDCWERDHTLRIQNSLWTNNHFISICVAVFFVYASSHSTSQLMIFVFQRAQALSILQSSWRYLPIPIIGALSSILTGRFLSRVEASKILIITIALSALAPFLMAISNPDWPYWKCAITAVSLNSIASNAVIPIAGLMVSGTFSADVQALAMGVLCTVAMIGASVGMALTALISNDFMADLLLTPDRTTSLHESPEIWMTGYRSAFWFLFLMSLTGLAVTLSCLRNIGYLGRTSDLGY
ncbi:hypothetical protein N7457_005812 [Penicillium paradoxum]|uniref:uncharacterized protein n=1 Tax=Penicillium paradoxum TaxID=176176 RepID=UPI002548E4CF|nr:uncharacterized protein N7457_005812 [Penicillium paradoxum]KAJ5780652.1 hypothetical protein N7457_005812 [Penicillium paradoxum]